MVTSTKENTNLGLTLRWNNIKTMSWLLVVFLELLQLWVLLDKKKVDLIKKYAKTGIPSHGTTSSMIYMLITNIDPLLLNTTLNVNLLTLLKMTTYQLNQRLNKSLYGYHHHLNHSLSNNLFMFHQWDLLLTTLKCQLCILQSNLP